MTTKYDCSVVIPVKNGDSFVKEAILSCLQQKTKYNFEIIVCNDNSTDNSLEIIKKIIGSSPNVSLNLINSPRPGIVETLNHAIANAKSQLIVRLDQDDLMSIDRIQTQIQFLFSNLDVVLVGSQIAIFGERKISASRKYVYPETHQKIVRKLPFTNCFAHPAVAFRKEVFTAVGGYRQKLDGCEDYDLWLRMVGKGKVANLSQQLTSYRLHYKQHSHKHKQKILLLKLYSLLLALWSSCQHLKCGNNKKVDTRLSTFFLLLSITLHLGKIVIMTFRSTLIKAFGK